jgi:hypothetical protein
MASARVNQGCLFEHDFLRRTLGAIANTPEIALTELVSNAWDAGATTVTVQRAQSHAMNTAELTTPQPTRSV